MLRDFDTTIDVQRLLDPGESICICSVKCERCCESIVNICISYIVNQNKKQNKKQKQKQKRLLKKSMTQRQFSHFGRIIYLFFAEFFLLFLMCQLVSVSIDVSPINFFLSDAQYRTVMATLAGNLRSLQLNF